jgi:PST family polysaccharide transporter
MVAPINRAVLPGYVKMAHDLGELRKGYLEVISLIALLALPAAAGIAATSELLVAVLLGAKWAAAAPLISILALAGAISALETNIASVYMALGKPKILTMLFSLYVLILLPLLTYMTIHHGVTGAAWACLIAGLINIPFHYGAMFYTLKLRFGMLLAAVWRPVLSALIMYFTVREFTVSTTWDRDSLTAMPYALIAVGIGVIVYLTCIGLFWRFTGRPAGAETIMFNEARDRLRRLTRKS